MLVAILKVADGLDHTRQSNVSSVQCIIEPIQIKLLCHPRHSGSEEDLQSARQKGGFFEKVYHRKLMIEWELA
ncbi:MAG TPA: hypothetical protein VF531_13345 [Bacillota bacterium]